MRSGGAGKTIVRQCAVEAMERRVMLSAAIAAFAAQQTFGAGLDPRSATVADLNRDGKLDVIVANAMSGSVSVLLGNGSGALGVEHEFGVGGKPYSVAVGDVNGDGKPDLVVANYGSGNISVLRGNGDGTFTGQVTFAAGNGPYCVALADLNGDGKLDAAVADYADNAVSVLLGVGNGTFGAPAALPVGTHPNSIVVADVNGDGKLDVLASNYGDFTVGLLLGNGNGSFQGQHTMYAGPVPISIATGDLNSDGKPDIAVVGFATAGRASVLPGNGDGTFGPRATFATGSQTSSVAIADINRDGKLDLVVTNFGLGNAGILLGNGDGSFQTQKVFPTAASPASIAVGDINGDGRPDLVGAGTATVNSQAGVVSVLLGDVPPKVLAIDRASSPGPIISNVSSVAFAVTFSEPVTGVDATDFALTTGGVSATTPVIVSGSGAQYTVTVNGISGIGTLGLNLVDDGSIKDSAQNPLAPQGTPQFEQSRTVGAGLHPAFVISADINSDGKSDLVVANAYDESLSVLLGNGDGTFRDQLTFHDADEVHKIVVADVNGDGRPDLVSTNVNYGSVYYGGVYLGNGDGTFQVPVIFPAPNGPYDVAVADLDGDGIQDLVTTDSIRICVLLGNGDGAFQRPEPPSLFGNYQNLTVSDLNGDGKPDILAVGVFRYVVLLGNGNGVLHVAGGSQSTYEGATFAVAVGDLNGDGRPDLAISSLLSAGSQITLQMGNGDGTFTPPRVVGSYGFGVSIADVNGDGKLDLLTSNRSNDTAAVLLGNGDGSFQTRKAVSTVHTPYAVVATDLNGDGIPDLVVGSGGTSTIGVLLGNASASLTGQAYTFARASNTITATSGIDQITLGADPDLTHIDWTIGTTVGQILIDDPSGLTINSGGGGADVISLDYSIGDPLPHTLRLNGTFRLNGLDHDGALDGTILDIGSNTIYVQYYFANRLAAGRVIRAALAEGYNGGGWNGQASEVSGAITTSSASASSTGAFGIGSVDSSDLFIPGQFDDSIELRYTVMGDTNLDGVVNATDAITMARNYLIAGRTAWNQGNFNYDGTIDYSDALILQANFNRSVPVTPSIVANSTPIVSAAAVTVTPVITPVAPPAIDAGNSVGTPSSDDTEDPTPDPHGKHVVVQKRRGEKPDAKDGHRKSVR